MIDHTQIGSDDAERVFLFDVRVKSAIHRREVRMIDLLHIIGGLFHRIEEVTLKAIEVFDGSRHPKVARLFPDYRKVEQDYFSKTGIFPIMHAVAIKKSLLDQEPWLAEAVFAACSQAKGLAYDQMTKMGWASDMLPWYGQELETTRKLMGDNIYSYGIEGNRKTLEALFRYSHEQGFSERELKIEDLFDAQSLKLGEA